MLISRRPAVRQGRDLRRKESLKDLSDMISAAGGSVSVGIGLLLEAVAGIVVIVGGGLALAKKA
jgi:uncharacterized membrane protein